MDSILDIFRTQKSIDRRKVKEALVGYPVFSPPFPGEIRKREKHQANYDYFMREKPKRLEYLAEFFTNFSLTLDMSSACIEELDRWLYRYGAYLVKPQSTWIFNRFNEPWEDNYVSLNVILDVGIFFGDYVVQKNERAHWGLYRGDGRRGQTDTVEYMKPCILFGEPIDHNLVWQPAYWVFTYCRSQASIQNGAPNLSTLTQPKGFHELVVTIANTP